MGVEDYEYGVRYVDVRAGVEGTVVTAVRLDVAEALIEAHPEWYTLVRRGPWEEVK